MRDACRRREETQSHPRRGINCRDLGVEIENNFKELGVPVGAGLHLLCTGRFLYLRYMTVGILSLIYSETELSVALKALHLPGDWFCWFVFNIVFSWAHTYQMSCSAIAVISHNLEHTDQKSSNCQY